jgi:hypothetical protein
MYLVKECYLSEMVKLCQSENSIEFQPIPFLLQDGKHKKKPLPSLEAENKSGWQDSNLRPPRPKRGAIPGYATPRTLDFNSNTL